MSTQVTQNNTTRSGLKAFNTLIQNPNTQSYLKSVLADKSETFITSLTSLMANSQTLQECDALTVMYSAIKATALGLPFDPNLGQAYCIPYNNRQKGIKEAQFQIGYKGLIQLALRSGQFKRLNVTDVREGELSDFDLLSGDFRLTATDNRETLPVIGYAAYFKLTNGFEKSLYWKREKVQQHALRYSQTYSSKNSYVNQNSKWTTDFDAMALKTVLKLLLSKYAPMSVAMQQATQADQAVIHVDEQGNEQLTYIDNEQEQPSTTTATESEQTANAARERAAEAMRQATANAKPAVAEEIKEEPTNNAE